MKIKLDYYEDVATLTRFLLLRILKPQNINTKLNFTCINIKTKLYVPSMVFKVKVFRYKDRSVKLKYKSQPKKPLKLIILTSTTTS